MDPEDILSTSLESLYSYAPVAHSCAGSLFTYTAKSSGSTRSPETVTVRTPETHPANWSLHASSIWVASLYLADHLDFLELEKYSAPVHVLELGAGAGLPGILIAKTYQNVFVTTSDYPDEQLMRTLSDNVERNSVNRCRAVAYAWGSDSSELATGGFDVIVAADTLWNSELHPPFIKTLQMKLKRTTAARIHLVAGLHTGRYTIQAFLNAVGEAGFEVEKAVEREVAGNTERKWSAARGENEDERERRRWVLWVSLRWKLVPHIESIDRISSETSGSNLP
jgi:nicotinamide N-methyltransferase